MVDLTLETLRILLPYIYGAVSILIIIFLYIAYSVWKIKRMIKREIESEY